MILMNFNYTKIHDLIYSKIWVQNYYEIKMID